MSLGSYQPLGCLRGLTIRSSGEADTLISQDIVQMVETRAAQRLSSSTSSSSTTFSSSSDKFCCNVYECSSLLTVSLPASTTTHQSLSSGRLGIYQNLITDVKELFDEVRPELFEVSEILSKLAAFRQELPGRYSVAFISLSLREVLLPLITADAMCIPYFQSNSNTIDSDSGESCSEKSLRSRTWYKPVIDFTLSAPPVRDRDDSTGQSQSIIGDYDVLANKEAINSDEELLPKVNILEDV